MLNLSLYEFHHQNNDVVVEIFGDYWMVLDEYDNILERAKQNENNTRLSEKYIGDTLSEYSDTMMEEDIYDELYKPLSQIDGVYIYFSDDCIIFDESAAKSFSEFHSRCICGRLSDECMDNYDIVRYGI